MSLEQHQNGWVIFITFVVAYVLMVVPLPEWALHWRPAWVTMVLIYWCIALPERTGVFTGWLVGLFLDVLVGTVLGQHALSLSLVSYISLKLHHRLRVYPLHQQVFIVFILVFIAQLPGVWIRGIQNYPTSGWVFMYPAIVSLFLWPWVSIALRRVQHSFQVR